MRKNVKIALAVFLFFTGIISACKKDTDNPTDTTGPTDTVAMIPYPWVNPQRFPIAEIPENNKMYVERVALGKKLFYDSRLSNNGESCNTCHLQSYAFAAPGVSNFDKGFTKIPLINLAWNKNFMWGGRIIGTLEDVMYAEVTKRFSTDIAKINAIEEYKTAFKKYYGVNEITANDLAKALAQFMRVLTSYNSKYDRYVRGEEELTPFELAGYNIYFTEKGDCFHCHPHIMLSDNALHNNGLDSLYAKDIDKGNYLTTLNEQDLGKFKVPTLRNVALRTDLMHDGRFKTLQEVVNFYDHGVHTGVKNIDPLMVKPAKLTGLKLTEEEKAQLIAFLNTFTDTVMVNNAEFKP